MGTPSALAWTLAVIYLVLVYAFLAIFGPGVRHLAFQTTQVDATLASYSIVGVCEDDDSSLDRTKYQLTLSWVDGQDRTGDYTTCEDFTQTEGARIQAWVTSSGEVASLTGPLLTHLLAWVLPGLVLIVGSGAAIAHRRTEREKRPISPS